MNTNVEDLLINVIHECYQLVLNRKCDEDGIKTYLHHFKQGKTKDWLIEILRNSEEYKKNRKMPVPGKTPSIIRTVRKKEKIILDPEKEIINIFMCVRDNESDIEYTLNKLKSIEDNLIDKYTFHYYILENDSSDNTPHIIIDFFDHSNGKFRIEKNDKRKWGDTTEISRVKDMAYYRNLMLELCNTWEKSKYSFILDTGITFNEDIISKYINILETHNDIVMTTPYGTVNKTLQYYDTFALKVKDKPNGYFPYTSLERLIDVESAFGGFVCIRSKFLKDIQWEHTDEKVSEHNSMCKQLLKHGRIVIVKDIKVEWKK